MVTALDALARTVWNRWPYAQSYCSGGAGTGERSVVDSLITRHILRRRIAKGPDPYNAGLRRLSDRYNLPLLPFPGLRGIASV